MGAENFGCGSSRETAVYALWDHGFRVVIAPSFGEIFDSNAFKNGLLTIRLPAPEVDRLLAMLAGPDALSMTVDLREKRLSLSNGHAVDSDIDGYRRECLLNGLDELRYTLNALPEIHSFEETYERRYPWGIVAAS